MRRGQVASRTYSAVSRASAARDRKALRSGGGSGGAYGIGGTVSTRQVNFKKTMGIGVNLFI
jgi:hypothetical protein